MEQFRSLRDVQDLSHEQALDVYRNARDVVAAFIELGDHVLVSDDTWDYANAAITNYQRLHQALMGPDFGNDVRAFLMEPVTEWLACDGDIRFELFTEAYVELAWRTEDLDALGSCEWCGENGTTEDPIEIHVINPPTGEYGLEVVRAHKRCASDMARSLVQ